jgi:hypothetical protein
MIDYIPDLDQEEETLITAKIDSALERFKKRRFETTLSYVEEETDDVIEIRMESSARN